MRAYSNKGFTLIELMITIAIVGILASVAIPSYKNYIIRAKLVEGINLMTPLKTMIAEHAQVNGAVAIHASTLDDFINDGGDLEDYNNNVEYPLPAGSSFTKLRMVGTDFYNGSELRQVKNINTIYLDIENGISEFGMEKDKLTIGLIPLYYPDGTIGWRCGWHNVLSDVENVQYLPSSCQNELDISGGTASDLP